MLKSSDKGSAEEVVVFLKNNAGICSWVSETDDFKEELTLDTISAVKFRSTNSVKFEMILEQEREELLLLIGLKNVSNCYSLIAKLV